MKKNLRLLWCFPPLLFMLSCAVEIENNKRLDVLGTIVDDMGQPIPNIEVVSQAENIILGFDSTDAQGNFHFTSLETNARGFEINVNPLDGKNTLYTSYYYINGLRSDRGFIGQDGNRDQELYDLGVIALSRVAVLKFTIKKNNTAQDTLTYTLTYPDTYCEEAFNDGIKIEEFSKCRTPIQSTGKLTPENPDFELTIPTVLGADVQLSYRINSVEEKITDIPIMQNTTEHVLQY